MHITLSLSEKLKTYNHAQASRISRTGYLWVPIFTLTNVLKTLIFQLDSDSANMDKAQNTKFHLQLRI